jgi:hypothetical protein
MEISRLWTVRDKRETSDSFPVKRMHQTGGVRPDYAWQNWAQT